MNGFAATLASQLTSALPATAPLIKAALRADPGLLNNCVSLTRQLERLVYEPFQAIMKGDLLKETISKGPFDIVIDGLDECEDKQGVEEFIDHLLDFFQEHPRIPLRIFIASQVEQHICERLEDDRVQLCNLDSHSPYDDIKKFLQVSFCTAAKRDRVIRAYIQEHGEWPMKPDMDMLTEQTGGSFLLASTIFKYTIQPATAEDPTTPMDRLPFALRMNGR
ncbi:hypothetical protein EST38_g11301 [Candolleomyces aberdarensis]|uniref:Nephrocystin 3-like N-terminal domain-containing protein n=1 Tax=Candolleomyces aberdarensis TaxID=2316362 RepID=A0A4Q2D7Y5_9AGAR|nr:hypothetical protein EST38_g11301 [Candolleomyces aberdarensis]